MLAQQSELSERIFHLSEVIASRTDSGSFNSDLYFVDSVFNEALLVCNGDYSEALLALTFSFLPYNEVPLQSPVLKYKIRIPVYSAPLDLYLKKNPKIPRYFFYDSPNTKYADEDKLAHFFGSAFLSYSLKNDYVCMAVGYFVEIFEAAFKVEGGADFRDLTTNKLGIAYGLALKNNHSLPPSSVIRSYNAFQIIW